MEEIFVWIYAIGRAQDELAAGEKREAIDDAASHSLRLYPPQCSFDSYRPFAYWVILAGLVEPHDDDNGAQMTGRRHTWVCCNGRWCIIGNYT
jgi:hypothetical protein